LNPPRTEDNTYTVLDIADLVFFDPAETGFSRVLSGGKREAFYTSDGDANAAAQFVENWSRANGRETSPKFVLGESYGTIRAALMAGALAKTMPLDGVYLFGQAINIVETSQRAQNVLGYATNLPALASVAVYHGKASLKGKSMSAFIDDTYQWSMGEYLQALLRGHDLPLARQQSIAQHLQQISGIDAKYYLEHNLVITKVAFARELLKDRGHMVASYDARYSGPTPKPGDRGVDPFESVRAPIIPLLMAYLKDTLAVTLPMEEYRDFAPGAGDWVYTPTGGAGGPFWDYDFPGVLDKAFAANPRFHLMIGTGIYDLTTTAGPARYLVSKSDYPRDRVSLRLYAGGHMAYTNEPALAAFTADVRAWLTHSALPPPMKLANQASADQALAVSR
jgi:carboxypeptidase C (cathepsin A)